MNTLLLVTLAAVTAPSLGHEILWGSCPSVKPVADFDMERFSGLWYVIEKFDNDERCVTWNISKGSDSNTWVLLERKATGFLSTVGLDQDDLHTATITLDPGRPGVMSISWRLNIVGSYRMTVHSTDYDHFAGAFECQQVAFFQRQQATVLSRKPNLQIDLRQMARLDRKDIRVEYYRPVSHGGCGYEDTAISAGAGSGDPGPLGGGPSPANFGDFIQ
ncbi:apolipoprotein D [Penaeus vannamei]|uniref:Putative apolipoprotein D-like n=1 Tax=Penaeus vannamei TaxID=6689 RepID=A0A423U3X4_PENVA|nr:apolipoprotein D-like [Penaeus vannamei]ROT83408.1 putative apolipoprotein D-like [Penaeus vannamei]